MAISLTGLCVADKSGAIQTFDQLGGRGAISNKALAIPVHLGFPWNSIEYVVISPPIKGEYPSVGEHQQQTDEIYYVLSGEGELITNGTSCIVSAGFLAIAPKGTKHSIRNLSSQPLTFLVVELQVHSDGPLYQPTSIESLPALLQDTEPDVFHPARGRLRIASVDLSDFFAAPWGMLSLVEIPPGGCIYEYVEPIHDENLFVISGNATIEVAGIRFDSWQDGLNVLVPKGVPHKIINRSSVDSLTVLCLSVRPLRNMGGTICSHSGIGASI